MPLALTTSVKSGVEPTKRAPLKIAPPTLIEPALRATPSAALTRPSMEMSPDALRGAVPFSSCVTARRFGVPGEEKKLSTNAGVGVETVSEPTLTTPLAPTTKPLGLANQTLPPMRPSLIAFRTP